MSTVVEGLIRDKRMLVETVDNCNAEIGRLRAALAASAAAHAETRAAHASCDRQLEDAAIRIVELGACHAARVLELAEAQQETARLRDALAYEQKQNAECLRLVNDTATADVRAAETKLESALELIHQYGGIDGAHHKQWVLDQIVRDLAPDYTTWVAEHCAGEDGPDTYDWDEGIAP